MKLTKIAFILSLFMMLSASISAQETSSIPQKKEIKHEKRMQKRLNKILAKLELSNRERISFAPLLEAYFKDKMNLRNEFHPRKGLTGKKLETLSDKELQDIIEKSFVHRREEIDLQEAYYAKFRQVLPIKKIAKLFHMERRMKSKSGKRRKGKRKHN